MKGKKRRLDIILGICYAALAVCVLLTLFLIVVGSWKLTVVFGSASVFLFAIAVVLNKERRISRMMHDDNYPEH